MFSVLVSPVFADSVSPAEHTRHHTTGHMALTPRCITLPSQAFRNETYHSRCHMIGGALSRRRRALPYIVACQWGKRCGVELDDLTAAGIARHLKEYHVQDWDNRARARCEWHGSPCTNSTMYYASFGKHIASVHLGATARPCDKCGETFARADTLDRHMKLYCRLRSK
ncbi:hypothetical protein C8Q72DRAFT_326161 [Fomitopsis betulina]|nr:hypothetical protein C8Q72DRAFT_326161 [Fomitopsis betulina]